MTKANAPTTPPESTIIGQGTNTVTIPSSLVQNGMSYAQTLQTVSFKKEKGSDHIPEFELPSLNKKLERKLQILETNGASRQTTLRTTPLLFTSSSSQPRAPL